MNDKALSQKAWLLIAVILVAGIVGVAWYSQTTKQAEERVLTISTTTSLYDTGLLEDAIAPAFKDATGIELHFIPKGTGAAIQDAMNGAADAIIVHARSKEIEFMENGYGVNRKIIAYNFFVIVGPENDPAGIKGLSPVEALKKIVEEGRKGNAIWVSRDDGSGTNTKEIALWEKAGYNYSEIKKESWFRNTGTGMGKTLNYCNNVRAYTLSDMGTYLKYRMDGLIDLAVLVDKGEELINIYAIIVVNPEKFNKDFDGAMELVKWLTSREGQKTIGEYGVERYGRQLFYPAVEVLEKKSGNIYHWIVKYGFIENNVWSECPAKYRYKADIKFFEAKMS
ncbi:ABC-type tungstate transport system, permease component [Archaeoglobus sulfaticallidus PM70-1]|uniref:ABC-type tungstate transport system, permease component n=1 Tax=Archaeoglobus sulfaticallidus PM70-1 TaxID=387631 RepID=N0BEB1_9EURY|nr:substrate-binding domain-containing protein [Archaeoglobus sulfaticallidus]AGK60567.1 ABC-type tungstate transport system, permease component [Archaeoglobus sulfaticallidus PM70-1]